MRIVIDLQGAQTGSRFRGIGRYSTALAEAMVRQAGDHDVWLLLNDLLPDSIEPIREAFGKCMPAEHIVSFAAPAHTHWDTGDFWRRRAAELIRESFLAGLQPDVVHVCSLFEGAQEDAVVSVGRNGTHRGDAVRPHSASQSEGLPRLGLGTRLVYGSRGKPARGRSAARYFWPCA